MIDRIFMQIAQERVRQNLKWGEQNHANGTGSHTDQILASQKKAACDRAADLEALTWLHILDEEVAEVFAEADPQKLRAELVQVAAVCVQWIECLDRKAGK